MRSAVFHVAKFCLLFGSLAATALAQPSPKELADNPSLFLSSARTRLHWDEPVPPAKVVGQIYFVGTKGLASYLIAGDEGHVLLYTGMPGSGEMIERSINKLGFDLKDVKMILTGHAHVDHVGGHAYLKKATGAKIAMMREEVELFESGGKLDFHYGNYPDFAFEPSKVDTVLHDKEEIKLGNIAITALLTPGHTKGSTTYVMKIASGDKTYTVVFPDGTSVNPGYRVEINPSYPGIADNFHRTYATLESLRPDIWLQCHTENFKYEDKLASSGTNGDKAWIDTEGYQKYVAGAKSKFEAALKNERVTREK